MGATWNTLPIDFHLLFLFHAAWVLYRDRKKKCEVNVRAGEFWSYVTSRKVTASNFFKFVFDEL